VKKGILLEITSSRNIPLVLYRVPKNLFGVKKEGSIHPSTRKAVIRIKNRLIFASIYIK
jgi:hypothetical protein